jgi:hypothetical protein
MNKASLGIKAGASEGTDMCYESNSAVSLRAVLLKECVAAKSDTLLAA